MQRFEEMVKKHGGSLNRLTPVAHSQPVLAQAKGFVSRINAERLGLAVIEMKGGRQRIGDPLDHSTGIEFLVRLGDQIEVDQPIANLFCPTDRADYPRELVAASLGIQETPIDPPALIIKEL